VAGMRAAYAKYVLELAGRTDIPIAAGAQVSMTTGIRADPVLNNDTYWPTTIAPAPSRARAAVDLLRESVAIGASLVCIGPLTNLAVLEQTYPGTLGRVPTVVMGGWVEPPATGLPQWGPDMDFNIQWDTKAAQVVADTSGLTLVTLPATLKAHLRASDVTRLRAIGPLGELIATQSTARSQEPELRGLGRAYAGLPDDLLNFHYDPVACAVAAGWQGATVKGMHLKPVFERKTNSRLTKRVD